MRMICASALGQTAKNYKIVIDAIAATSASVSRRGLTGLPGKDATAAITLLLAESRAGDCIREAVDLADNAAGHADEAQRQVASPPFPGGWSLKDADYAAAALTDGAQAQVQADAAQAAARSVSRNGEHAIITLALNRSARDPVSTTGERRDMQSSELHSSLQESSKVRKTCELDLSAIDDDQSYNAAL